MKWYFIIGAVIVIIAMVWFFFFSGSPKTVTTTQPTPGLPIAGSTVIPNAGTGSSGTGAAEKTISFATPSGAVVTVLDFVHNGETVQDVQNPGSFVLAGSLGYCLANGTCSAGASTTDFSISYNEKTHFFNIILLAEPLGTIRLESEQFLSTRLGIVGQQLCSLNYFVGTPYWVNAAYDSKNLGFSVCPGATVLPK